MKTKIIVESSAHNVQMMVVLNVARDIFYINRSAMNAIIYVLNAKLIINVHNAKLVDYF